MADGEVQNSTFLSQVSLQEDILLHLPTSLSQTRQGLRDRIISLQQHLDNSLSFNENLPMTSLSSSQLGETSVPSSSPILRKTRSLSPAVVSSRQQHPHNSSTSPQNQSPHLLQSPPSTDAQHLKQKLAEARETCLKLDQQHSRTELSRMQGSLQALIKIQEHLTQENQSLSKTFTAMEEEKESLQQEAEALGLKLSNMEEELSQMYVGIGLLEERLRNELEEATGPSTTAESSSSCSLAQLQETALIMIDDWRRLRREVNGVPDQLRAAEEEREARLEELDALQRKLSVLEEEVSTAQDEAQEKGRALKEKEDMVSRLEQLLEEEQHKVEREKDKVTQEVDNTKKILDNQYEVN